MEDKKNPGDDLLSHKAAPAVPSALETLTTGFGMLPGVSLRHNHREKLKRVSISIFESTVAVILER